MDSKDCKYRSCNSSDAPIHHHFWFWKIRFKNQVTTCSDFPLEAMLWIKEVEMVGSLEELKSSRSVAGKNFPIFEMLDAKIAPDLNKIIQKLPLWEEGQSRGTERGPVSARKTDRFHDLWLLSCHWCSWYSSFLITLISSLSLFMVIIIQKFFSRWDEVRLSMSKIPSDDILESPCKLRIRESVQLKIVLELYDMEIHQKRLMTNYQKLKTMVKRSIDQKLRLRNLHVRHGRLVTGAVVMNRVGLSGAEGGKGICYQWREKCQCSKGDQCNFPHESNVCAQKPEPKAATLSEPSMSRGRSVSRNISIRGKSNHGAILRQSWRCYLESTCTRSPCEYVHPPECQFCKNRNGLQSRGLVFVPAS